MNDINTRISTHLLHNTPESQGFAVIDTKVSYKTLFGLVI